MRKGSSYLGGHTITGSSVKFAGWGTRNPVRKIGLVQLMEGDDRGSRLIKREDMKKIQPPSKRVRQLRERAKKYQVKLKSQPQ